MGLAKVDTHDARIKYRTMEVWDHFGSGFAASSTGKWNTITTGSGASVSQSAGGAGGILTLVTGATQNNEAAVYTPIANFIFDANQAQTAFCDFYYTEGSVNQAGIVFGLASSWTHILADTTFALPF